MSVNFDQKYRVFFNGSEVTEVYFNGTRYWQKPPQWEYYGSSGTEDGDTGYEVDSCWAPGSIVYRTHLEDDYPPEDMPNGFLMKVGAFTGGGTMCDDQYWEVEGSSVNSIFWKSTYPTQSSADYTFDTHTDAENYLNSNYPPYENLSNVINCGIEQEQGVYAYTVQSD